MSDEEPTFLELLCERRLAIMIVLGIAITFFLITVPMLFVYEWGSANNVITVFNVIGSGVFMLGSYAVLRKCKTL